MKTGPWNLRTTSACVGGTSCSWAKAQSPRTHSPGPPLEGPFSGWDKVGHPVPLLPSALLGNVLQEAVGTMARYQNPNVFVGERVY